MTERERARAGTRRFNAPTRTTARSDGDCRVNPVFVGRGVARRAFRRDYGSNVHVGEDVHANADCVVPDVCRVESGRNYLVDPGVHVHTAIHPLDAGERAEGLAYGKPVTVGDDVWVGERCSTPE